MSVFFHWLRLDRIIHVFTIHSFANTTQCVNTLDQVSLVHIRGVNLDDHSAKVGTVRKSPFNTDGQDSTKSGYSTISSSFQNVIAS